MGKARFKLSKKELAALGYSGAPATRRLATDLASPSYGRARGAGSVGTPAPVGERPTDSAGAFCQRCRCPTLPISTSWRSAESASLTGQRCSARRWQSGAAMTQEHPVVLVAASEPWAFTQERPLTTSDFCKEAERRGVAVREEQLPDLWRAGVLAPFVEIRNDHMHRPSSSAIPEPVAGGTWLIELRLARDSGRLADAEDLGFRPQLRFFRLPSMDWKRGWWNGLLYSRWQLIGLYAVKEMLRGGRWRRDGHRLKWRCPELDEFGRSRVNATRRQAAILVALEARYLPTIESQWISLTNAEVHEWDTFRVGFDPQAVLGRLGVAPDELVRIADGLLLWLKRVDPLGRDWSELVRRAPRRAWKDLTGDALVAIDHRVAAEILLSCYEDLAGRGVCAPLGERTDLFHSGDERLSYRSQPLDANLSSLGISPHPGVVLVVEGETEEVLVPLVRDHVLIPNRPELVQSVVMRGTGSDLTKLAAFASAPLIDRHQADAWLVAKPPTHLMVVVDPDPPYDTPQKVEAARQKIVEEIATVVRAQGVEPMRDDIDSLVSIRTWTARCFEFAHFTDEELADTLLEVHGDCGGLDRRRLIMALAKHRQAGQDVKTLWTRWRPRVQKPDLARRLWPTLRDKLDRASNDEHQPVPEVAQALLDAYHEAARRPVGHFVIRGSELSFVQDAPPDRQVQ